MRITTFFFELLLNFFEVSSLQFYFYFSHYELNSVIAGPRPAETISSTAEATCLKTFLRTFDSDFLKSLKICLSTAFSPTGFLSLPLEVADEMPMRMRMKASVLSALMMLFTPL